MKTLKPCPFCGGAASLRYDGIEEAWDVCCYVCDVRHASFADQPEAIAAWNRRADPLVEELRGALRQAEDWFREYADLHRAKCSADGDAKAQINTERADYLREALALPVGNISACTDSAGEEPDGSFASDSPCQSEGGAS